MPKVLIIGIAAVLAVGSVLAAAPAQAAAPKPRSHIVTVAGSDGYVIFERASATRDIKVHDRNNGKVYARDTKGTVTELKHFADGVGVIEQTGHTIVEKTYANVTVDGVLTGVERVRQRDLATGQESQDTLQSQDSLATVAPDGYVVRHDVGDRNSDDASDAGTTTLTYRHTDGSTAAIAVPFANHLNYVLQASEKVLLATTPSNDEQTRPSRIAYMTWANPGVWHAIYNAGRTANFSCAPATSTHVACRQDSTDGPGLGPVLFRLKDGHATWLLKTHPKACAYIDFATKGTNLYAVETSDAGVCTKGKLYRLQDDGRIVGGSKKYLFNALGGITTAYGKVVLSGGDQRHLYTTTGVTQKPVIIAKA
jgi:hypothetical protein